ncbi:hypothetical protein N7G274_004110 [Stereocaulon virgatum]|uniref:Transcription factor SipA3 n=1 Tax=Stereocaulon virgatum TaxID=373712 RepID=A0ABR4ADT3_9LECA
MADVTPVVHVGKPITLIPVGLKEAALDSPTFRCGFVHFSEQLDQVEKWLESYVKCITKLSHEMGAFESLMTGFLSQTIPPTHISEAVLDHDYTLLAMKRYGEGTKEFWIATISGLKRMEANMAEPIKAFLHNDLRSFKDVRRNLDQTQKQMDNLQSRYSGQSKTKEASSLREDAFQLHEARKAYLKASMDFSVVAPQLRMALDKMLVRVFSDQWRDMRSPQQKISGSVGKWGSDIDRVRGWSREMETGERTFKRELLNARKQIEESAEAAFRPSRELEDYAVGIASASGSRGPSTTNLQTPGGKPRALKAEKQGWLNLRTVSGKPSRTVWLRRWFYVKNGIFGWLVQGSRSGGVEESERIGVLLCNVRAGNSDDRRHVFEVKTKDTTIILQAETQPEFAEWLAAFDVAKRKALEDPASTQSPGLGPRAQDPAFAISPPSAPEFAASDADAGVLKHTDDSQGGMGVDRSSILPVPGGESLVNRSSFDVTSHRRSFAERDTESSRDPASRIIQKLDLHRRGDRQVSGSLASPGLSGGGIASLIAASHSSMPVGPAALPTPTTPETPTLRRPVTSLPLMRDLPVSTLAPNTLANPPAPTNLSSTAVIINGEKGIGIGRTDASGGMPSGIMANVWGSSNWGHLNRLARGEVKSSNPPSPLVQPANHSPDAGSSPKNTSDFSALASSSIGAERALNTSAVPSPSHRKTISLDGDEKSDPMAPEYPTYYPLQLKTQNAQFRLLFPNVRPDEKPVLVFKATWNPNEQQDFPGRVYLTAKEIYFYSNHCGMTLISSIGLDSISEITAASGKDCDFIFCHLKEFDDNTSHTRITMKTFLEPLNLLQRRLNFLVSNRASHKVGMEEIMKTLIRMEQDDLTGKPGMDGWENLSINTPTDGGSGRDLPTRGQRDLRANISIDRGLYGNSSLQSDENSKTFKLPKQPVIYIPSGMNKLAVEKDFDISPKALFHVMFGDKSAVWQLLYHERRAQRIKQGPWTQPDHGHLRRDFEYQIEYLDLLRRTCQTKVEDHQMVDVANEHLLYVVSDRKRPWHLPHREHFLLLTKVVITHLAKSRCKLAVYIRVDWTKDPPYAKSIVSKAALKDLELDALDLTDVIAEQVRTFASAYGRTKKAIQIFGYVGGQTQATEFSGIEVPLKVQLRRSMKRRTLVALAFESFVSIVESVLTSALQMISRVIRWTWSTVSANSIILAILGFSILVNVMYSSSSTSGWWRERKARKFMTALGIGPDMTMSKSIYIPDLEEATILDSGYLGVSGNQCRDIFNDIMNLEDAAMPYQPRQPGPSETAAALQLRKSRQHLGSQRHDLLVAMRVVNSIEREMVQAQWENWLVEENAKCKHVGALIQRSTTELMAERSNSTQRTLGADPARLERIRIWHRDYCDSCNQALQIADY